MLLDRKTYLGLKNNIIYLNIYMVKKEASLLILTFFVFFYYHKKGCCKLSLLLLQLCILSNCSYMTTQKNKSKGLQKITCFIVQHGKEILCSICQASLNIMIQKHAAIELYCFGNRAGTYFFLNMIQKFIS